MNLSWAGGVDSLAEHTSINSFLPPFANSANRQLDEDIKLLQRELQTSRLQVADNEDRAVVLADHLESVQKELRHIQTRLAAQKEEIAGEEHLQRITYREEGRCHKDLEAQAHEQQGLLEQQTTLEQQVGSSNERLQQFKDVMNWNEEELQKWAVAALDKEEDRLALAQYQRQDESKVKELNAKLDRLAIDVAAQQRKLDAEATETRAIQAQLEATADEFRQQHKERRALTEQWDAATAGIRRRDEAIMAASERFAEAKAQLREREALQGEQAAALADEQRRTKQVEMQLAALDRDLGKKRATFAAERGRVNDAVDDLENLKSAHGAATRTLKQQTASCDAIRQEVTRYAERLQAMQLQQEQAGQRLAAETGTLDSLEARADRLASLLQEEERRLACTQAAVADLNRQEAQARGQLSACQQRARALQAEISNAEALRRTTILGLRKLDELVAAQQEMMYGKDFALIMLERKLARQMGQRTEVEMSELNERIAGLTAVLDTALKELNMLQAQVKQAEDNIARARRVSVQQHTEREDMQESIKHMDRESRTTQRCLTALNKEKEEKLVQRDAMGLDLTRLRSALDERTHEVIAIQTRNDALRASLACRRQEIEASLEVLHAELKLTREDLHRVACELKGRAQRMATLRAKHDTLLAKHGADAESESQSQAHMLVSSAQKRAELQQQTAAVHVKIVVADKEVNGLHAALVRLTGANHGLIQSFKPTAQSAEAAALQESRASAERELGVLQQRETQLAWAVLAEEERLQGMQAEAAALGELTDDLERQQMMLSMQLDAQNDRYSRAVAAAERRKKALRAKRPDDADILQMDAELTATQAANKLLLSELADLASQQPDRGLAEAVQALGLKMPGQSGGPSGGHTARSNKASRAQSRPHAPSSSPVRGAELQGEASQYTNLSRVSSASSLSSVGSGQTARGRRPVSSSKPVSRAGRPATGLSLPMQTLQINV